jgi:hypothetical protein
MIPLHSGCDNGASEKLVGFNSRFAKNGCAVLAKTEGSYSVLSRGFDFLACLPMSTWPVLRLSFQAKSHIGFWLLAIFNFFLFQPAGGFDSDNDFSFSANCGPRTLRFFSRNCCGIFPVPSLSFATQFPA